MSVFVFEFACYSRIIFLGHGIRNELFTIVVFILSYIFISTMAIIFGQLFKFLFRHCPIIIKCNRMLYSAERTIIYQNSLPASFIVIIFICPYIIVSATSPINFFNHNILNFHAVRNSAAIVLD